MINQSVVQDMSFVISDIDTIPDTSYKCYFVKLYVPLHRISHAEVF